MKTEILPLSPHVVAFLNHWRLILIPSLISKGKLNERKWKERKRVKSKKIFLVAFFFIKDISSCLVYGKARRKKGKIYFSSFVWLIRK